MNEWEWQLLENKTTVDHAQAGGVELRTGDRVRLHPRKGGDIFDIALAGQVATIEAIEQDYEGKFHVCVVLDDDPGRDMGMLRQPGHRFFFDLEEVEPLPNQEANEKKYTGPRILIAGVGNIFLGDDAFGVEVARRMSAKSLPKGVKVVDFGIRGFDLAYALQDDHDTVIIVDACRRGNPPGTICLIEPDLESLEGSQSSAAVDGHNMDPLNVLRLAKSMQGNVKPVLIVGCEPATVGGEEGHMGLSPEVEAAIEEAVRVVEAQIETVISKSLGGR
jgi:hydrogenase maturation protease